MTHGASDDWPEMLCFEAAVRSSDVRLRTVAKILDLLCALVRIDVAVFYVVDEQLERYAVEPIVAKINQPPLVGIDELVRSGKHGPFAPMRVAHTDISVLSFEDVHGEGRCSWPEEEAPSLPVAEMYLRAGDGTLAAVIALFRDPAAHDLAASEIWMLRDLHGLCEHCYRLATGAALC